MSENNSLIGQILRQRYQVIEKLGKGGGFGETYLAEDLDIPEIPKPRCVVKRLKPTQKNAKVKSLFEQEARTLNKLGTHQQIPTLYAYFEHDDEFYLVQELIDGNDLTKEINHGWNESKVIEFLAEILELLIFVHDNNVIHRDIKPANIMRRNSDGKLVLIDFGAVKEVRTIVVGDDGQPTSTITIGTPGYMPVEQLQGRPQFASDIYAVGVTAIQALVREYPQNFPHNISGEIDCETILSGINDDLANILIKMVKVNWHQRYPNAQVALAELLNVKPKLESLIRQQEQAVTIKIVPPISSNNITQVPESQLEPPSGQVRLNSPFYIERMPIESESFQAILKPDALIRIKAPRQMGKSSLLSRILAHASQQNYRTVSLNFQTIDADFLEDLDKFLQWFCANVSDELDLEEQLDKYWKKVLGVKKRCTKYFDKYLLNEIKTPIVLGLDEVDEIFQNPDLATQFFALLRAWHEQGKNNPDWQRLRLIIVHSKEVYIPLNINQSPFNVGLGIELPEFNLEQVKDLVQRHGLTWSDEQIEKLMEMLGGHPYLVRLGLYEIASLKMTLERLLELAPTDEGPYYNHLHRHLLNLQKDENLQTAISKVVNAETPVEVGTIEGFKLRSMGLVKFRGNAVVPLCGLYRKYFQVHV
ncbi:serine/threonine protein kinase [Hydrocoleum sp. CS-953]|uniref:AAA-like domain-containing protein n=1 Tax=Hydrocoleum sp. CS-953 TaxID=1671698 RepID=UPI000B9B507D|nr:AAA-like domain-containing protein [Hydrocoleum sp. CS-953]OZH52074.1 serine/threonine protein kinase [Hydrocoleum sp. CS-953]